MNSKQMFLLMQLGAVIYKRLEADINPFMNHDIKQFTNLTWDQLTEKQKMWINDWVTDFNNMQQDIEHEKLTDIDKGEGTDE